MSIANFYAIDCTGFLKNTRILQNVAFFRGCIEWIS